MTNYITEQVFTDITGVSGEEVGEMGADNTIREGAITKAQLEFEKDVMKKFDGTEEDYALAQKAVAFLAAHNIHMKKRPLVAEGIITSPYLKEYQRTLKLLKTSQAEDSPPTFTAGYDIVRSDEAEARD